ncbi:hypothetical protein RISK_005850 [Rhodopirellula islandica]|uniref:Uncharacterized protein n=1 Tax=Rhodopirellula islandica TaxID=595434 RepID=A0A0J1E930_RHOIS|nr:hypothetical protein [Rhodopirellula islandica]KLU02024.1 hypothetical protein RISK_005850 [Rhodopirellula islandica]
MVNETQDPRIILQPTLKAKHGGDQGDEFLDAFTEVPTRWRVIPHRYSAATSFATPAWTRAGD